MNLPRRNIMLAAVLAVVTATASAQTPIGQWDFNQGDLSATLGTDLQYADGPGGASQSSTVFGTTANLGISNIAGAIAKVLQFPAYTNGMGILLTAPGTANGAGTLLNNYTVIFDLYYGTESDGKVRPLIQTDDGSLTGHKTAIVIGSGNGIGSQSGASQGAVLPNTWNRIGLVFNSDSGLLQRYVNGSNAGDETIGAADGSYALVPGGNVLLLANNDTNAGPGFLNSLQFWDVALNPGQMLALGSPTASGIPTNIPPIPSYIASRYPAVSATGIEPQPNIQVQLQSGNTTISQSSIKLYLDTILVGANVAPVSGGYSISYTPTNILASSSTHDVSLIFQDSVVGKKTNTWSFTVAHYQNVTLPSPIYLETFDELAEGSLPDGWSVTNHTVPQTPGYDLNNPVSDAYLNFVVISSNRLSTVFPFDSNRRLLHPFIVLNGAILDSLVHGNLLYADSDQRQNTGGQVNVTFTKDYDLTGKSNVFVAWNSSYEQNQDNIGTVEYSIDQGATWLPVIYYLDDQNQTADIIRTNGVIDITATFGTARNDQAYNMPYSNYIGAAVGTNLIPYVAGRINDNQLDGKRIEVVRIAQADNQSHVRFRIGQAGTSSWYFGVDDFGLYSINTPVITVQPISQSIDAGTSVSFSVSATSSSAVKYQWQFKGKNIVNATNSAYFITSVAATDAGLYTVIVSNNDGPVTSDPAVLTVVTVPQILTSPASQYVSAQANISLTGSARGGRPLSYSWSFNGNLIAGTTSTNLSITNIQSANAGLYALVVSNSYGLATSAVARITVVSGDITDGLVAHLKFDGDYNDATANMVNGQPVGTPTFETGLMGQAIHLVSAKDDSTNNYVTLGYPDALKFGTNNFSIAFWAKVNAQSDDKPFVGAKDWNSGGNVGWVVSSEGGGMKWNVNDTVKSGRRDSATVAPQLLDHTWHQVTVTFERSGFGKIYVDGSLADTTSLAPNAGVAVGSLDTDALNLAINLGQDGTGTYTDGSGQTASIDMLMDDLGFWNRIVTAQEVASIYVQGKAGKDLSTASGKPVVLPPSIGSGPMSQSVSTGGSASFTVVPTGTGPFTYQWLKNGAPITTATNSILGFTAQASDEADYSVMVSNDGGSVTSSPARLMVYAGTITRDLVVHLSFDGDYSDSSGRFNHATPVGSPSFAPGKLGQAMKFTTLKDGSSFNYAKLGTPADLLFGTNSFSVSLWVNYTNQIDDPAFIANKDWNSSNNKGWGVFSQGGGNFRVNATGPAGSADKFSSTLTPVIRDGTWHLLTVTFWRGQTIHTYVDGALIEVKAFATAGSLDTDDKSQNINIGQDGTGTYTDSGGAQIVNALVDDVGIWRRVLTDQEVAEIFTAAQSGKDLTLNAPLPKLTVVAANNNTLQLAWTGAPNTKLQTSAHVGASAAWSDVPNTLGASSATIEITASSAYFRLILGQ